MEEEERSLEDLMEEGPPAWERGYRAWQLKFVPRELTAGNVKFVMKEPRLVPMTRPDYPPWEPGEGGEILSDWVEGVDEPFEETTKGLYCLRDYPTAMKEYGEGADVVGAIIPYGKTFFGDRGYRSEKAKVDVLFRKLPKCYVCLQLAKFWIHNDQRFPVCERCLTRVERLLSRGGYTAEEVEVILERLADIYEAEVVDPPE